MAPTSAVVVILYVFLLGFAQKVRSTRTSELKRSILDQIISKNGNDALIAPGSTTNGSTVVQIFVHILGIDKLNEEKMDFTVRLFLRQLWKDDKLKYDSKGQFKHIVMNEPDLIWTPDTFFSNEKKGHAFDITQPNIFVRIYPDGSVICSRKLSITASCPMNLKKFPFDKQQCKLQMGAYGSTTDDVILLWRDYVPVTVSRSLHMQLFTLDKFVTFSEIHKLNTGEFSVVTLSLHFSRELRHYVYHTYIPCTMLVILSWIPFWLNSKQLTSRLLMGVAPLLTCALIVYDQNKNRVKLSYTTCMDCFTGTCLTFMFASVIGTVVVHLLAEKEKGNEAKDCTANGDVHKEENKIIRTAKAWIAKIPCKTHYIDVGARFALPIIYVIFCMIYFSSVGSLSVDDPKTVHGNQTRETLLNSSNGQK